MSKYTIRYNDDHSGTLKCDKCGSDTCICTDTDICTDTNTSYSCLTNTSDSSSCLNTNTSCLTNTSSSSCTKTSTCSCDACKNDGCDVSCLGTLLSASSVNDSCNHVENNAQVFVYEHGVIRPNKNRGVNGPLILGSRIKNVKPSVKLAIDGDIYVSGTVYSDDMNSNDKALKQSTYIEGIVGASYRAICPKDTIIYVNPMKGPVVLVFNNKHEQFKNNYQVTIKDISLNHQPGSSYNIYITTYQKGSKQDFIEHYDSGCKLASSSNGIYIINTTGGAVTYRYYNHHFMIENQFIGNERILSDMGLVFDAHTIALAQDMLHI